MRLEVVLELIKEKDTLATISKRYEIHPNQITDWNQTAEAEAIYTRSFIRF